MNIKKGLGKHRYSLFLSLAWAALGALVFWFLGLAAFPDVFSGRTVYDSGPLLYGSYLVFAAIALLMISARKFPYANSWEILISVCLAAVCALFFFLAATRHFYSGSVLAALSVFSAFWFGLEVHYRNSYVEYKFVASPSSLELTERDFPEQQVLFAASPDEVNPRDTDAIIVASDAELTPEWVEAVARFRALGMSVLPLPEFLEGAWGRIPLEFMHKVPVAEVARDGWYGLVKPAVEWLVAALAAVIASPLMLAAAVLVKATSRGPVLFRQERVGLGERVFTIYKFRTMLDGDDAEPSGGRCLTPVGGFLRKYHLDELPQLFNVLKGDMAIVGPRPETKELTARYKQNIPGYALRTMVRQGVVSWALIHQGNVSGVEETRIKLSYDLYYLKHMSALLDLYIALKAAWFVAIGIETLREPPTLTIFPRPGKRRK